MKAAISLILLLTTGAAVAADKRTYAAKNVGTTTVHVITVILK